MIAESSDFQATMMLELHGLPMSILHYNIPPRHTLQDADISTAFPQCTKYQYNRATHIVPFLDKVQGSWIKNYLAATEIVERVQALKLSSRPVPRLCSKLFVGRRYLIPTV